MKIPTISFNFDSWLPERVTGYDPILAVNWRLPYDRALGLVCRNKDAVMMIKWMHNRPPKKCKGWASWRVMRVKRPFFSLTDPWGWLVKRHYNDAWRYDEPLYKPFRPYALPRRKWIFEVFEEAPFGVPYWRVVEQVYKVLAIPPIQWKYSLQEYYQYSTPLRPGQ